MNKFSLILFLSVCTLLWSCEREDATTTTPDVNNESDLLKREPDIVEQLRFMITYETDGAINNGYLISSNGKVTTFSFATPKTGQLAPGSYDDIVGFFEDADKTTLSEVSDQSVENANTTALALMDEYDQIVNDTSVISASAKDLGTCEIYHMQKSGAGVSPVSYYPIRLLEGTYDNDWYVTNSALPSDLISQLNVILASDNGINLSFWEHYISE